MSKASIKAEIDAQIKYNNEGDITGELLNDVLIDMIDETDPEPIEKTYAQLKALRDAGQLLAGHLYRITDFVTTTSKEGTRSAGNAFDIIVRALTPTTLSESAHAAVHSGDTHFAGFKLEAWKVGYCLDNDAARFSWADTENGKGVIWYLEDEYDNRAFFDFKNIQFLRDTDWFAAHEDWATEVFGEVPETDQYYYLFTWVDEDGNVQDASLAGQTLINDEGYVTGVYGNHVGICAIQEGPGETTIFDLPGTVIVASYAYEDGVFYGIYSNTFGNGCNNNTFGNYFQNNTFGNDCNYNTFGNYFQNNTFGNNCASNTFGNGCNYNTFGNDCASNTFGNVQYCAVGQGVQYVSVTTVSGAIKFCEILSGVKGTNAQNLLTISFLADKVYSQFAGLDSNGDLNIWNPAD